MSPAPVATPGVGGSFGQGRAGSQDGDAAGGTQHALWLFFLLPAHAARCVSAAAHRELSGWAALSLLEVVSCRRRRIARGALVGAPSPLWGALWGAGASGSATDQTFSSFFFLLCWDPARKREGERMAQLRTASWARVPWMTSSTCPPNSASRPVPGRPGCPLPPPRAGPSARRAPPVRSAAPPAAGHLRVRAVDTAPPRGPGARLGAGERRVLPHAGAGLPWEQGA